MEEIFEDKVLDDLCDIRTDGFERKYLSKYGKPKEFGEKEKNELEIMELIKKYVPKENQKQIIDKFQNYKENLVEEIIFWQKPYYKMGFVDGMSCKRETLELQESKKSKGDVSKDSLIYKYVNQFIKEDCFSYWKEREDYKTLSSKMNQIKEKYHKVRAFLEDDNTIELNEIELKALKAYIELDKDIKNIELEESFKWGLKEGMTL